jgi:hypothetical protein
MSSSGHAPSGQKYCSTNGNIRPADARFDQVHIDLDGNLYLLMHLVSVTTDRAGPYAASGKGGFFFTKGGVLLSIKWVWLT